MSRRSGHAFTYSDHVHLALGWGAGHAACHALFLFASLLPLTAGDGSYYSDSCPWMSVFLVGALNCLGTCATLVAAMAVGIEGWRRRSAHHAAFAPAAHLASALLVGGGVGARRARVRVARWSWARGRTGCRTGPHRAAPGAPDLATGASPRPC